MLWRWNTTVSVASTFDAKLSCPESKFSCSVFHPWEFCCLQEQLTLWHGVFNPAYRSPKYQCGAARREWMCLAHGIGNVVFQICFWYCDVRTNFWRLRNSWNNHLLLSSTIWFISEKKRGVSVRQSKEGSRKILKWRFFGHLTENIALKHFCFRLLSFFCQKNRTWTQKEYYFWNGMNLSR